MTPSFFANLEVLASILAANVAGGGLESRSGRAKSPKSAAIDYVLFVPTVDVQAYPRLQTAKAAASGRTEPRKARPRPNATARGREDGGQPTAPPPDPPEPSVAR